VKVQVTKSQFIETDDIQFAEQDELDANCTRVWLRDRREVVDVYVDYEQFVWTINDAAHKDFEKTIRKA
jgi:hypothetical protein